LPNARVYDLLDSAVFLARSRDPNRLGQELTEPGSLVVIDEVQRLPEILNEVHRLIELRGTRFLLTGSSARKLRGGGVNRLGGRARTQPLHPLTFTELGEHFDLDRALTRGRGFTLRPAAAAAGSRAARGSRTSRRWRRAWASPGRRCGGSGRGVRRA